MKRLLILFLAILSLFYITGCFKVVIESPATKDVYLVDETKKAKVKDGKKVWYALWGLVPISDNTISDIIMKHDAKKIKVTQFIGVDDAIISLILGLFTIATSSIEVEIVE
ncbi:MAG: hypothetical protein ABDH28_04400 [Brevinematia bacterium]